MDPEIQKQITALTKQVTTLGRQVAALMKTKPEDKTRGSDLILISGPSVAGTPTAAGTLPVQVNGKRVRLIIA